MIDKFLQAEALFGETIVISPISKEVPCFVHDKRFLVPFIPNQASERA